MEGVGKKWEKMRQGVKEKRLKERKETRNNVKERRKGGELYRTLWPFSCVASEGV